jgi:mRNA interferase MazF
MSAVGQLKIASLTRLIRPTNTIGEVIITDWRGAGSIKPSVVKPVITTIEASLVLCRSGRLAVQEQQSLRAHIGVIVG